MSGALAPRSLGGHGLPASRRPPLAEGSRGIVCPQCGGETGVIDSRPSTGNSIKRRRCCYGCGSRWTTYETVGNENPERRKEIMRRQAKDLREAADALDRMMASDDADHET